MSVMAFSPVAGGYLAADGTVPKDDPRKAQLEKLVELLDQIAQELGTHRTAVALAWLLKHPAGVTPIVGTTRPERIRESVEADGVELTRDQWYSLLIQARGERLP